MKRNILWGALGGILVFAGAAIAQNVSIAAYGTMTQTEVLVLTTATLIPTSGLTDRRSIEIYNNGPNAIYCGTGTPVVNKAREIGPDSAWAIDVGKAITLKCIAATAAQVTTAATIVTEVR